MRTINAILSVALAACAFVVFGSGVTPYDQPVLVDTSASAGGVIASSSSSASYSAEKAFDGAWSTISSDRWLAYINPNKHDYTGDLTGETPAYVTYKFNTATKVNVLRIRIPGDQNYACSDRAPKAWTFSGSNDNSTWTPLDTRSGVTWASGEVTKEFFFSNQTAYEYYKFVCTEIGGVNDYLQIYELQFLCAPDMTALVCSSELTFPAAPATALENFPILLRISPTAIDGFSYAACPNASHLWFTDDGYNLLPFEVDTWEEGGTSLVWVSVPSFSRSTTITMHWAGDTANVPDEIPAPREVWTRSGYRGVWHFSGSAAESVTNLAATAVGSPTYNGNASYPGPLGKTLWLNGSSHLYFANNPSWATIGENSTLTISCWARATAGNYARMISSMSDWKNTSGYELTTQSSSSEITVGSSGTGSNGSQFQTQIAPGVNTAWQHFTATYSGTTATLYVNGASAKSATLNPVVAPTQGLALGSISGTTGSNLWTGGLDEVRIRAAASTAAWIAEECATMTNAAYVSYGKATADASAPVVATPVVTRDAGGGFTVTVGISQNVPTSVCCVVGNVTNVMTTSDSELPMTYSATLSGFAADTTYACVVSATSAGGSAVSRACPMTLYTGDLAVEKLADASESTLAPGVFRITRADTAYDLPVFYTVGGTATAGQTYEALSGTAIIPAGTNAVDVVVVPILDQQTTSNTTVTITLDAGLYGIDAEAGSAELTIANLVAPAGFNLWVAAADGLASVGSNWSEGHSPTSSEKVLFDGRFSTANCEWDAGATVASWTQTNGYTGTVTFKTTFPEADAAFTAFTITGDATLCSGKWTHPAATAATEALAHNYYRLKVSIGGTLTICSGASISVSAKGTWAKSSGGGGIGGSYGGQGNWGTAFGSLLEPSALGESASTTGNSANLAPAFGGGAVWLEVTGKTVLDGKILSDGIGVAGEWADYSWGSGGSIYLSTASLAGTGTMSASGDAGGGSKCKNAGSGGRISILLTSAAEMSFPSENITAYGSSSYSCVAGTGTIVVRTTQKTNGTLYLRDRSDKYGQFKYRPRPALTTPIPAGQTWILDSIVFGKNAILRVPTGTTLDLRGGLASVSSTGNTLDESGLIVDGGTLLLPAAETHTISGKWIFEPTDFALDGNLVVTNGAGVGTLLLYSTTSNEVRTCGLSVSGNMHVASGAYLRAVRGGYIATGAATVGGTTPSCHGGQSAGGTANCAYDSFFHPRHPGAFGNDNGLVTVGGGAIRLAVGGTLTLDGTATATPPYPERRSGAAGSIDITAARLEGAGQIEANGNSRNYTKDASGYGSGGGRIAVRLTGAGETISDAWLAKINAKGFYSSNMTAEYSSSAGSIYLQNAAQAEGTGTIIIRNTGDTANNVAFTAIPSTKGGGEDDNFKKASLALEAAARVKLFENLKMASLEMASGTVFDLNGKVIFVKRAKVGGEHLMPGTYTPAKLAGYLVDSASGGELVVTGGGLQIHLR